MALEYFRQATGRDPTYAEAYNGLGHPERAQLYSPEHAGQN